jgi:putative membrane protein insertion efficiency factor
MTTAHAPGFVRPAAASASHAARTVALVPRNVAILLLGAYRAVISPLYGDVCRYYPSCSAYALGAVQKHGLFAGGLLAIRRLLRCHPWAAGGVDEVPESRSQHFHVARLGIVVADHVHPGQGKG